MLTSSERKDYILRMIEELRRMVQAILGKVRDGEPGEALLAQARTAVATLLGPLAEIAPRMDSVTAGQMVNDPDVLGAWAEVTAADAQLRLARGETDAARMLATRALELALEAHLRTPEDRDELLALIASLVASVDRTALAPRHADALAALPEVG